MSLFIKGIEIPKCCTDCFCCDNDLQCTALGHGVNYKKCSDERQPDCPLVEVSTPHGDLIDKNRIMFELGESTMSKPNRDFCIRVLNAKSLTPTIIEAEE